MTVLVSLSPLLLVIALCAGFRWPAFVAAWVGVAVVALLMTGSPANTASLQDVQVGLSAAGLITLQALFVIGPGLYLNELLLQRGVHARLVTWVEQIPLSTAHKSMFIVVGVAPALESLTGFGVSLLVTVPLLLATASRPTALRLSLLSMNIMPWGTLALATTVGAQIAKQPVATLGWQSALISFGVFPLLAATAVWMASSKSARGRAIPQALALGILFSISLAAANVLGLVELAGVGAGGLCAFACFFLFDRRQSVPRPPWTAFAPFGLLLALVVLLRALPYLGVPSTALTLRAGGLSFSPLASPGLALAATALLLSRRRLTTQSLKAATARAYKPVLALGGFTTMAQLMICSGMIGALGHSLPVTSVAGLSAVSPWLGLLSGYLTGSNVGGNAMMMSLQTTLGASVNVPLLFAAIQNSAAGHAVFASMPIVLLVLAISGGAKPDEESGLVRFGLLMGAAVAVVLTAAALLLLTFQSAG